MTRNLNVAALIIALISISQSQGVVWASHTKLSKEAIRITGKVTRVEWANEKQESINVQIRLRLKNVGRRGIIVYKRFLSEVGGQYFADVDGEGKGPHIGEWEIISEMWVSKRYAANQAKLLKRAYPNNEFFVLKPGKSLIKTINTVVPAVKTPFPEGGNESHVDKYEVEIEMGMWYEWQEGLGRSLRRRWRRIGFLQTDSVWSESITFSFPRRKG